MSEWVQKGREGRLGARRESSEPQANPLIEGMGERVRLEQFFYGVRICTLEVGKGAGITTPGLLTWEVVMPLIKCRHCRGGVRFQCRWCESRERRDQEFTLGLAEFPMSVELSGQRQIQLLEGPEAFTTESPSLRK